MSEISSGECLNCRATLAGPWCAACGQKAVNPRPTFHDLVHEYTHELFHVDGRLWRSIGLLLSRPGFLTREHCAGRRARYLAPLRLYLIFSVLAFATGGLERHQENPPGATDDTRSAQVESGATPQQGLEIPPERVRQQAPARTQRELLQDWLPRLMLVMLPVWALLVMMVTRRAHRTYPEHLYFALHGHAAFFAVVAADNLLDLLPWPPLDTITNWLALAYWLWYGTAGMHLLYGGGWIRNAMRGLIVAALYLTIVFTSIIGLLLVFERS